MRKVRLILLTIILGTFAVLSPLLMLRATGHRLDMNTWRLVATGSIAVTVFPIDTELSLELDEKTTIRKSGTQFSPTVLFPNLLPGTYRLSAHTNRNDTWSKNVEVFEGRTTSFPFVRLFNNEPAVLGKLPRVPKGIAIHPVQPIMLAWDDRGIFGIHLDTAETLNALSTILTGSVAQAEWLGESDSLLVRMQNGSHAVITKTTSAQPSVSPLSRTVEQALPFGEQMLLVRTTDGSLARIQLLSEPRTEVVIPKAGVLALATREDHAVFLDQQGTLWQFSSGNERPYQRTVSPIQSPEKITKLSLAPDLRAVLGLTEGNTAWFLEADQDRFLPIAAGIFDAAFSDDKKKLLLESRHELSLLSLADQTDQPFRKKGDRETITRLGETITQAQLLEPEAEYTAFLANNSLQLIELDGRGGRNSAVYKNVAFFASQPKNARLFLVSPESEVMILPIPLPGLLDRFGPQTPH